MRRAAQVIKKGWQTVSKKAGELLNTQPPSRQQAEKFYVDHGVDVHVARKLADAGVWPQTRMHLIDPAHGDLHREWERKLAATNKFSRTERQDIIATLMQNKITPWMPTLE